MAQFAFNNSIVVIDISPFFINYSKYLSIKKILKEIKPLLERAYISI